jgi:predicted negative regulator of RcsB-dependent stress response
MPVININTTSKTDDQQVEYIYHWDRIIIAVLSALVLISLIGLFVFNVLNNTETPTAASKAQNTVNTDTLKATTDTKVNADSVANTASETIIKPIDLNKTNVNADNTGADADADADTVATNSAPSDNTITALSEQSGLKQNELKQQALVFQHQQTRIFDPRVKRFQLAARIEQREPKGNLNELLSDQNGTARIFAFSDVTSLKDQHLTYQWLRNGKVVASLDIGVWAKRWRSNASKIINRQMSGTWQVKLLVDDKLLAQSDFSAN